MRVNVPRRGALMSDITTKNLVGNHNPTMTTAQKIALLSLRDTTKLSARTQSRLASGKTVGNVVDAPVAYFRNRALLDRAQDFLSYRENIEQANVTVKTAIRGLESLGELLKQADNILESLKTLKQSERVEANKQFTSILEQTYHIIEDSSYQDMNLLNNSNNQLLVHFGVRSSSKLLVNGVGLNATIAHKNTLFTSKNIYNSDGKAMLSGIFTAGSGFSVIGDNNQNLSFTTIARKHIDAAITRVNSIATGFGNDVAILETRLNFTDHYTQHLQEGAAMIVRADMNEEAANLISLQTRQQLTTSTMVISGQQQKNLLDLF